MTKNKVKKTDKIELMMTPNYKERIRSAAAEQDMNLTDFVKSCLNKSLPKTK